MASRFVPDFDLKIQGVLLQADVRSQVTQVTYDNHLDSADMFEVELVDPGARFIDSPLFSPGKTVELQMGYAGQLESMMLGEITAIEPSFTEGSPKVVIRGYDKSHRMRHNERERSFVGLNDSLIAAQIAAEYLLIPVVDPALQPPEKPGKPINQRSSDFSFLNMLAHRNGFEVFVRFDKLHFQFPRPQFEPTVLDWGTNLISFSPRLSTATMPGTLEVRGYNDELAQSIVAILPAIAADLDSFEMLGETAASLLVSLGRRKIENPKASNPVSAATLAMATLKALLEGLAEASGSCPGNPKMRAGEKIRVNGVGKRFSGTYRLRRVTHTISDQGYQTHFEASQRASMTLLDSLRHKLSSVPVLDPPTAPEGVAIGIVETNFDPTGHDRILVGFPAISKELFCWARLARPDAGDGTGTFFVPDRGDEVVVAFVHGGIDNAIILGSFWNQTRRAPESLSSPLTNFKRVIQTSSGHRIEMDDTPGRERLLVKHANVGQVVLEATPTGSSVSLEDTTGNSLKMTGTQEPSGSEIAIKSVGSVTITAVKGITIVGDNINLESKTGGVKISSQGQKIALRADDIDLTVKNTVNANKG